MEDNSNQKKRLRRVNFAWDTVDLLQAIVALAGILISIWHNQLVMLGLWVIILFQDFAIGKLKGKISSYRILFKESEK